MQINENTLKTLIKRLDIIYKYYFRVKVIGFENVPLNGPGLLVGNHNGGINSPDMLMLFTTWYKMRGFDSPLCGLAHEIFFKIPFWSNFVKDVGAIPASKEAAHNVFIDGGFVVVYPGGDKDAFKSYGERHKINFFGRKGFIRLALREAAPIIPVVAIGGHETFIVLSNGRELAKKLGLNKLLRINVLPFSFSIPWGFSIGPFLPYIPFPVQIKLIFGSPITFPEFSAADIENEFVVNDCYERVEKEMQAIMDRNI